MHTEVNKINTVTHRQSNLELLRIIAMLMIIAFHITWHCVEPEMTNAEYIALYNNDFFGQPLFFKKLFLVETCATFGKSADAVFILISGYFLIDGTVHLSNTITKIVTEMMFAAIVLIFSSSIYYWIMGDQRVTLQDITLFNGGWWFAGYYVGIVSLGHYVLNPLVSKMERNKYTALLLVIFSFFSMSFLGGLLGTLGANLRVFAAGVFLFLLGGYIRRYNPLKNIPTIGLVLMLVTSYGIAWISYYNSTINSINKYHIGGDAGHFAQFVSWYDDYIILPVAIGIIIFSIFLRIRIPYIRIINVLSTGAFMTYLIHENTFMRGLWLKHDLITVLHDSPIIYVLTLVKWSVIIYGVGFVTHCCYTGIMRLVNKLI